MAFKLVLCLALAIVAQQCVALNVNQEIADLHNDVNNQVVVVTDYAASENPNTLTEQAQIGVIIGDHVENFDKDYANNLQTLLQKIEVARQQSGQSSPKGLCLRLQQTKIDPARKQGINRANEIQTDINNRVGDLNANTAKLIEDTKLDLDVKTIVQLCLKLYTSTGQARERLACFDDFGSALTIAQKAKGEGLLERVDTIEVQSLRIADQAEDKLRNLFAQNSLDHSELNKGVLKCIGL